jgi:hypothetical protein
MTPSRVAIHTNSKVMSSVRSGLILANAINPSRTACLGSELPRSWECTHYFLSLRDKVRRSLILAICISRAAHHYGALSRNQGIVGVTNNHAHRWWYFTSRLWQHNCIILRIRLIRSQPYQIVTYGSDEAPLKAIWLTSMFHVRK